MVTPSAVVSPLILGPAQVLVVDPPWPSKPVSKRWGSADHAQYAGHHYPLMSIEEIKAFPLPPLLDTAVLLLWRLAGELKGQTRVGGKLRGLVSGQQASLDVCEAWGFRPYGELVWDKLTSRGNPWFGMGLLLHGSHETCLVGVRKMLRPTSNERTRFSAKHTGQHSGKPDEFYELVERMYPAGPYAELFARRERPRWWCRGNELQT